MTEAPTRNGTRRRGRAGSRSAQDPNGAGQALRTIQYSNPRTGERGASIAEGVVSYLQSGELEDPQRPNKREVDDAIKRDVQLQALMTATILPLLFSEGHVEEAEGDSGEAEAVHDNLLGPEWNKGMTTPMNMVLEQEASAMFYRQAFFELVWRRDVDGMFRYHKLAFRDPTACRIRQDPVNGSFNGFVQEGMRPGGGGYFKEEFDPLYSYVFVHGNAMRPLLGQSLVQAPWHEHMHKNKLRWLQFRGFAKFGNGIIHIQTARTEEEEITALEDAGNNVLDGGVLITADDEPVNLLTPAGQAQFLDTLRELDSGMARAFLLPQIGLGQGDNTGTYALAKEHGDLFIMLEESRLNQIAENRTRYLIPPQVYLNFGPNAAYPSWKFPGLTDEGRELAKEIFIALLGRPQASVHPVIKAETEKQVARQLGADPELIPEHDSPEREVEQVPAGVAPDGTPVTDAARAPEAAALQQSLQALQQQTGGQVAASEPGDSPLGLAQPSPTSVRLHGGPTDKRNIPAHPQKSHGSWAASNRYIPRWKQKGLATSPHAKKSQPTGIKPQATVAKGLKPFTRGGKLIVPKGGTSAYKPESKAVGYGPHAGPTYLPEQDKVVAQPGDDLDELISTIKANNPKTVQVGAEEVPTGTFKQMVKGGWDEPYYDEGSGTLHLAPDTSGPAAIKAYRQHSPKKVEVGDVTVDGPKWAKGMYELYGEQGGKEEGPEPAQGIWYDPTNKTIVVPSGTHEDVVAKAMNTYPQADKIAVSNESSAGGAPVELLQGSIEDSYDEKGKEWPTGTLEPNEVITPVGYTLTGQQVIPNAPGVKPGPGQLQAISNVSPDAPVQPSGWVRSSQQSNKATPVFDTMPDTGSTYKWNMAPSANGQPKFWSGLPTHGTYQSENLEDSDAEGSLYGEYNPSTNILAINGPMYYDAQSVADSLGPKLPNTPKTVLFNGAPVEKQLPVDQAPQPSKAMPEVEWQATHFINNKENTVPMYLTPPPVSSLKGSGNYKQMGIVGKHDPASGEGNVFYYDHAGTDEMFKADAVYDAENEGVVPQTGYSFSGDYWPTHSSGPLLQVQSGVPEMPQELGEKLQQDFPELAQVYWNGEPVELTNFEAHKPAKASKHLFDTTDGMAVTSVAPPGELSNFLISSDGTAMFWPYASKDEHGDVANEAVGKVPGYDITQWGVQGIYNPSSKTAYLHLPDEEELPEWNELPEGFKAHFQASMPEAEHVSWNPGETIHLDPKKAAAPEAPGAPKVAEVEAPEGPTTGSFDQAKFAGHYDTLLEAEQWAHGKYAPWWGNLSHQRQQSVKAYKDGAYGEINGGLRKHKGQVSKVNPGYKGYYGDDTQSQIKDIDAALNAAPPLEQPIVVYRGRLPNGILDGFMANNEAGLVGKEFVDHGYQSTSLKRGTGKGFSSSSKYPPSVGRITVPKGAKVAYLETGAEMGEAEMLLPRGTKLRVTKAYREGSKLWVDAEAIMPDTPGKPKKKAKLTSQQRQALKARLQGGEKVSALAAEYGLSTGYLYWLKNN